MMRKLDVSLLKDRIERSINLLRDTYKSSDGHGGWYHYLDRDFPGCTASALGLLCFKLSRKPFVGRDEVLAFLKSRQFSSSDPRKNGGWAITMMPNQPSIEASGWVIKCLGELNLTIANDSPDVLAAYQWLLQNQNEDGGWGSLYGNPSRTYLTCLAMRATVAINPYSEALLKGRDWLFRNQNRHAAAWGATSSSPPTILHTSFVLITLAEMPFELDALTIRSSLNWLSKNIDTEQILEPESQVEDYDIIYMKDGVKTIYQNSLPHYALPVAISALLNFEDFWDKDLVYHGLFTIANCQEQDGSWLNARNPGRISIWAIWPFFQALNDALNIPLLQSAKSVTKLPDSVLLRSGASNLPLLMLVLIDFFWAILRLLRDYWSPIFLVLVILGGFIFASYGIFEMKDYIFTLIIPIALIFVQMSLDKKTKR